MQYIEFCGLAGAFLTSELSRPYRMIIYRRRAYVKVRIKYGIRTKEQYLADVRKHPPGTQMDRNKARLKRWVEDNGGTRAVARMLYWKRLERRGIVRYPTHHRQFLRAKAEKYVRWWKRALHLQENPPPPRKKKRKSLQMKIRRRLKRLYDTKLGIKSCQLIGCTTQFLKSYLESKFTGAMSWENHGSLWHIDHIIPLSKFNLKDPLQLAQSCHYTNLQPLLIPHNLAKAARIEQHLQTHFPLQLPASITHYPSKRRPKKIALPKNSAAVV